MKSTKLALVIILVLGGLSACKKPEPAAPAAEVAPPAAEPAAVTPEPVVPEPATTTAPATDAPADAVEDDDTPHSGGDKVGTAPGH
jgi:hypothetical protein